ncbi:UDP-xylose and UDP-N-acetylglucosamine transporter [Acropora cervicornis]|uniref:UDP-xylose and UDP-N-acetylglucosamine transporter n=1 Tax=Acropora cervicornis TaxID=6130 RepID=A0AAD9Q691_ACRCE|nr:UDP-xylose and UDP-N-acetylglucosamine transporter [Acropora cervicornis]
MHPAIPIFLVFAACCSNVVLLELIVRQDPSCVNRIISGKLSFRNDYIKKKELFFWCLHYCSLQEQESIRYAFPLSKEQMYAEYGKHPREALFYAHALPLPGFILLSKDIYSHIFAFNSSGEYDCAIFILCAKAKCYLPVGAKKKIVIAASQPTIPIRCVN